MFCSTKHGSTAFQTQSNLIVTSPAQYAAQYYTYCKYPDRAFTVEAKNSWFDYKGFYRAEMYDTQIADPIFCAPTKHS